MEGLVVAAESSAPLGQREPSPPGPSGGAASAGTVAKAMMMLGLLGDHPHGATAAEMVEVSGHPFSTTYRLLGSLVTTGFASYDPGDKRYRLGLRVFQLGQQVAHARGFDGVALPALRRLTEATRESSLLAVLDGERFLTVNKIDGPQFRTTTDPGDHGPLSSSALGLVLLAFADEAVRHELLETVPLARRTPNSVADRDELRARIQRVRTQGHAEQSQEYDLGMSALAVPVLAPSGRLIAALAVAAPVFRADVAGLTAHLPAMGDAAVELAALLPLR